MGALEYERAGEDTPEGFWAAGRELVVRTVKDAQQDRAPGLAAEVAFFALLSLPPLLLALFGVAGFVSDLIGDVNTEKLRDWVIDAADDFLSDNTIDTTVRPTIDAVLGQGRADVAILGLALALWSGSRAANVTLRSITLAYDLEPRPGWKRRAIALAITLTGLLIGLAVIPLLVLGPQLADIAGFPTPIDDIWVIAYWPGMGLLVAGLLASLYHVAVPWKTPWQRDLPGALLAVVMWLGGSAGLRVYTAWTIQSDSTYGPLATPIIVLLWLYVTALAVVMGAELNAEIEKMWPHPRLRHRRAAAEDPTTEIPADEEITRA